MRKRFAPTICILFLFVFGILATANAGTYTTDLVFETEDQSMWDSGSAFVFDYSNFFGVEWNETWGSTVWAQTSGKLGFEVEMHLDSGSVNITLPVSIQLDYPDEINLGETFTISSSYVISPEAILTTNSPEAILYAAAVAELSATVGVNASVDPCFGVLGGCPISVNESTTFADISEDYALVDIDSTNDTVEMDFEYARVTAGMPDIDTNGTLSGNMLISEGEDDFLEITADIDQILSSILGIPLSGSQEFFGVLDLDYALLDAAAGIILAATQDFTFDPGLSVSFALETGEVYSMAVGSSMDLVFPSEVGDFEITPTFWLNNTFTNDTGLRIDPYAELSVLQASAKLEILGIPLFNDSFGPVYSDNWRPEGFDMDIYSNAFQLQGFDQFTTEAFQVTAAVPGPVAPVPEPATVSLLSLGLLSLAGLRRKKTKI
ncbi:MAG: PEP-CTERM sorting domain-containing protein [Desulfococcaceae bacterium]